MTDTLPYKLIADPSPMGTLESLEQHLAELRAMPDFENKPAAIDLTRALISANKRCEKKARRKRAGMSDAPRRNDR